MGRRVRDHQFRVGHARVIRWALASSQLILKIWRLNSASVRMPFPTFSQIPRVLVTSFVVFRALPDQFHAPATNAPACCVGSAIIWQAAWFVAVELNRFVSGTRPSFSANEQVRRDPNHFLPRTSTTCCASLKGLHIYPCSPYHHHCHNHNDKPLPLQCLRTANATGDLSR